MRVPARLVVWVPEALVATGFVAVVAMAAAFGTNTLADLAGLAYLVSAPFLLRWVREWTAAAEWVFEADENPISGVESVSD